MKATPIRERFFAKVNKGPHPLGCWMWMGAGTPTHGMIKKDRSRKNAYAHRISWEIHFGEIADNLLVLHKCDNGFCVNPGHLFLGTQADNVHDMHAKGRAVSLRGESHGRAKLTASHVREIIEGFKSRRWRTYGDAGKCFGITGASVRLIVIGKNWREVSGF